MSDDIGALPPWQRPDNYGLAAHNRLVRRVNVQSLSPAGEIEIMAAPSGSGIVDRRQNRGSNPFKVLRVTGYDAVAGPFALSGGKYWARLQRRKSVAYEYAAIISSNLTLSAYYEDDPGHADLVMLLNMLESNLTNEHNIVFPSYLRAFKTGEQTDPQVVAGTDYGKFDVYDWWGFAFACTV